MKISSLFRKGRPLFSFEFFPPKTDGDVDHLLSTVKGLKSLSPDFVSVTWGAGGGTRGKTLDISSALKNDLGVETMAHLTCSGAGKDEINGILADVQHRGLENILALRGDPAKGVTDFVPHPDGFRHANELVAHLRRQGDFCLGVAGYPEKHPEAPTLDVDLDNLKRKADAGADFIVTQLFFSAEIFLRFRDRVLSRGIRLPLVAGIMPITNVGQVKRFTTLCGASVPSDLLVKLEQTPNDEESVVRLGINHALQQCRHLIREGVDGVHFYTLNRSHSTAEILRQLKP